jgi:hypothetical protein
MHSIIMVNTEKLEQLNGVSKPKTASGQTKKQKRIERYQNKLISLKNKYEENKAKYTQKLESLQ